MSEGSQPALAGMLTGPSRQASQVPATSVPPARDRTISRQDRLRGNPWADSRMLVPQDVLVKVTRTRTWVTGLAPDSVMAPGGEPLAAW